ncbi:MAG TPA: hemerythrin domain-containing protein, partial [Caulobacteraceae bacterium]|nr:hemerythrin domain-containing protein [Caulobacteraceae bacterium]
MAAMIEILRKEHRNIRRLLLALEHQLEVFANEQSPDYDVIVGVADYFLDYPDRCHHPKEELIVSKLLEAHPEIAAATGDLSREHEALHERALDFRATVSALLNDTDISRSQVVQAGHAFIVAQRRHMQAEEQTLFPLAARLLKPADWTDIDRRITKRTDPIFGQPAE